MNSLIEPKATATREHPQTNIPEKWRRLGAATAECWESPAARKFAWIVAVFVSAYFAPNESARVRSALGEALGMLHEYARAHVLTCLVPAFFIAGAIAVFVSKESVLKYFGAKANKVLAYTVASVSGTVLAVCSCTVLPLFAGLYTRGAGIGPATAFLYSGPAINVLAVVLTARVLGWQLGLARAVGAVAFATLIGLVMTAFFPDEGGTGAADFGGAEETRSLGQNVVYFATMVGILVFATWAKPEASGGLWAAVYHWHWGLVGGCLLMLAIMLKTWFTREELREWVHATWEFMLMILPLLFAGVVAAGLLLGRPGTDAGLIPSRFIQRLVGGNSLGANLFAAVSGALMYLATLTEVPILQGLLGSGMGKGPALALLLAGPAVSLPSLLVIRRIMGTRRMLTYALSVVLLATLTGWGFGMMVS